MKSSWKIGRLLGIDLRLHVTFLLLPLWVAFSEYSRHYRWEDVATGLGVTGLLFGFIILHELGHTLTARHFGIRTRDIILLPIGGVARMQRMPARPVQELLVAGAGPAINLVLALACFLMLYARGGAAALPDPPSVRGDVLAWLAWINLTLGLFNLLPAFPMDGGRVLRALLALRLDYLRATDIAAAIGRGFAATLVFVGLLDNPLLVLVGAFVWIGAGEEAGATRMHSVLAGVQVGQVMLTQFQTFDPGESLARVVNHLLASCQQDFPVCDAGGRVTGLLRRADVVAGLVSHGANARVDAVMQPHFTTAKITESVEHLLARCRDDGPDTVPVVQNDRLVGLFTPTNLGEYVLIQLALSRADGRPGQILRDNCQVMKASAVAREI